MNIIEMQDALKGYPDALLAQEVSQPSGNIPSYLAISELTRRKEMRDRFAAQQAPQSSVAEDLVQGIMGVAQGGMPQQPMMGQPPQPQQPVRRMALGGLLSLGNLAKTAIGATPVGAGIYAASYGGLDDGTMSGALGITEEQYYRLLKEAEDAGIQTEEDLQKFLAAKVGRDKAQVLGEDIPLVEDEESATAQTDPVKTFTQQLMDRYAEQDERAQRNALLTLGANLVSNKSPTFLGALGDAGTKGIKTLMAGEASKDKMLGTLAGLEMKRDTKKGAKETIDSINALAKVAEQTMNPEEKEQILGTIRQLRAKLAQQLGVSGGSSVGDLKQIGIAELKKRGIL